ncbi:hypothetical protein QAD02_021737 [Eretmocerus hayati]|uniref:Uncharacterized protein n=1 Tax=Eretmocerus hayati TaxID=131215 RepID=A0ACC2PQR7_9HYME|nr:hypothetical protein QAD02_021737 [Eretmocerus hayati]
MLSCPYFDSKRSTNDGFLSHIKLEYRDLMQFETVCTHFGCNNKFMNFHADEKHLISSHAQRTSMMFNPSTVSVHDKTQNCEMQIGGETARPISPLIEKCKGNDFIPDADLGQVVGDLITDYDSHCDNIKTFTKTAYNLPLLH